MFWLAQDFQATQRDRAPDHKRRASGACIQKPGTNVVAARQAVTMTLPDLSGFKSSVVVGSQSGDTGLAALSSTLGPISRQKTSEDSVSSSSESTSLSDVSIPTKEYENAATLERRGSVDQYLTARGDLNQTGTFPKRRTSVTYQRTNPIITFDPKERLKQRCSTKKQAPVPKPRTVPKPGSLQQSSPESPARQSIHAEMYSTAFALQALDDSGTWPKYLNTVRSIWDDQLHNTGNSDLCIVGNNSGKGQARSNDGQYSGNHGNVCDVPVNCFIFIYTLRCPGLFVLCFTIIYSLYVHVHMYVILRIVKLADIT